MNITCGHWLIEKVFVDDVDRTSEIDSFNIIYYNFYKDLNGDDTVYKLEIISDNFLLRNTYHMDNRNKIICFKNTTDITTVLPMMIYSKSQDVEECWKILRLTEKTMWFELEGAKKYRIHFKMGQDTSCERRKNI